MSRTIKPEGQAAQVHSSMNMTTISHVHGPIGHTTGPQEPIPMPKEPPSARALALPTLQSDQQVFLGSIAHLGAQGRPSIKTNFGAMYLAPDGAKCAVGCHIPPEQYHPSMEGKAACQLISEGRLALPIPCHARMLQALQSFHDDAPRMCRAGTWIWTDISGMGDKLFLMALTLDFSRVQAQHLAQTFVTGRQGAPSHTP